MDNQMKYLIATFFAVCSSAVIICDTPVWGQAPDVISILRPTAGEAIELPDSDNLISGTPLPEEMSFTSLGEVISNLARQETVVTRGAKDMQFIDERRQPSC